KWMIETVRNAAADVGRDPMSVTFCVAAPNYIGTDEAHMRDLLLTRIFAEGRAHGVHARGARVPDPTWYDSAHFNEMRIPLGIDDALYAFWPVPGVPLVAAIGFNRELHGGAFSQRDWNLAAILHDALIPFYRYLYRSQRGQVHPRLTPREREVYRELKTGLSEKEIAVRLGISRHTVHDHVKRIYVAFGVSGRAELLTRE
ncbi:MAG TPA: helix-turn-helix transcriptional regulator, partial [Phycisphaerae bacterium]|nr:helix-turn-helix transcriptional regulator [Phycisphaerae bacterium]